MTDEVLVDVADGIMTITLNRPEARNAANKALAEGVVAALDELDSNDKIRVAVLTGAGGTFCSGMDLKAFVSGEVSERTVHVAREAGIHYFAAGHHATERFGVQALATHLGQYFVIASEYIEVDNPV